MRPTCILLFISLCATGCIGHRIRGNGERFKPPPEDPSAATVVHYRDIGGAQGMVAWYVFENGELLTEIGDKGYYIHRTTGRPLNYRCIAQVEGAFAPMLGLALIVHSNNRNAPMIDAFSMNADAGKLYYVKWKKAKRGVPQIEHIPAAKAIKELKRLKEFPAVEAARVPRSGQSNGQAGS
jgi:hypothetical protein